MFFDNSEINIVKALLCEKNHILLKNKVFHMLVVVIYNPFARF